LTSLEPKQIKFCQEYLVDFNGTQAAIRAGYSKRSAKEQAARLLTKDHVQAYLSAKKEKISNKLEITQERTMREIAAIAFQDARKYFDENGQLIPIHLLDDEAAAALAGMDIDELFEFSDGEKRQIGITKKIKRFDKTKALEMLAKHFKIYSDAPVNNNNVRVGYGKEEPV
jgi:phage terminase small subunit